MPNDTTTLNGALAELGETLAANITSKGISASPNDGLTTLANKILQIPTEYLIYGTDINTVKSSALTKTITSDVLQMQNTGSSQLYLAILPDCYVAANLGAATWFTDTQSYAIEMDFVDYTTGGVQVYGTGSVSRAFNSYFNNAQVNFHLKITIIDSVVKYYIDNDLFYTSDALNLSNGFSVRFSVVAGSTLKVKNIKVYTI